MVRLFERILHAIVVWIAVIVMVSCDCGENSDNQPVDRKQRKENLEKANRSLVKLERDMIDEFVKNSGLTYIETGTGLRYNVVNQEGGDLIKKGNIVTMEYELRLLNGEKLYSSEDNGLKVFMVGRGGVESGLEEAVLLLHKGDEAEIIIPSHLAYGLLGDGDRIPPRSTIVYKIKVIDNQTN